MGRRLRRVMTWLAALLRRLAARLESRAGREGQRSDGPPAHWLAVVRAGAPDSVDDDGRIEWLEFGFGPPMEVNAGVNGRIARRRVAGESERSVSALGAGAISTAEPGEEGVFRSAQTGVPAQPPNASGGVGADSPNHLPPPTPAGGG